MEDKTKTVMALGKALFQSMKYLSSDQLMYWGRNDVALYRTLSGATEQEAKPLFFGPCMNLHSQDGTSTVAGKFAETFFRVVQVLPDRHIAHWAKNEQKLKKILSTKALPVIGDILDTVSIGAQEANTLRHVLLKKPFRTNNLSVDIQSKLPDMVMRTPARTALCAPINCYLSSEEAINQLEQLVSLEHNGLSVQQIRVLAQKQNQKGKQGLLSHDGYNHFLMRCTDHALLFMTLLWRRYERAHSTSAAGSWDYFIHDDLKPGRLFILE
ncbi:MAG TPA: hypothetical protein VGE18_00595 [Candidatus Paceibacterota bacterium]